MKVSRMIWIAVLLIAPLSLSFARGGGGVMWGTNSPLASEVDNSGFLPRSIQQTGGFGYGVDWDGTKIGGFGLSMVDSNNPMRAGGFGGVIVGSYSRLGPLTFAGNGLFGAGGMSNPDLLYGSGTAALFGQLDLEIGFPILPWFQVSVFGGLQAIMPIAGDAGRSIVHFPVSGVRITWGAF